MNYLQLCRKAHLYMKLGDGLPGTQPTTVLGQTDRLAELVQWVQDAWLEIQNLYPNWGWTVQQGTFPTVVGQRLYAPSVIPTAENWILMTPFGEPKVWKIQLDSTNNQGWVYYWPYDQFRGYWDLATRPTARPGYFTIRPDHQVEFDATPDNIYTVFCDYKVKPQTLTLDADDPANYPTTGMGLPERFHNIIVWRAIQYYCLSRSDQGPLEARANREYNAILGQMRRDYLPRLRW